METIVRQAAESQAAEIVAEMPVQQDNLISTLSSVEMSFVGGGHFAVVFE